MDDVIDRRTQLIYAALSDHELVRQLEEARLAAAQRTAPRPHATSLRPGRHRALGTRPWVPSTSVEDGDLMNADVTSSSDGAHVIDLREPAPRATTVDVTAPTVQVLVVRQQSSEWSADDPSYYLG